MLQNIDACAGERVSGRSAEDAMARARAAAAIGGCRQAIEAVAGDGGLMYARAGRLTDADAMLVNPRVVESMLVEEAGVAWSEEGQGYKSVRTGRRGNSVQFTLATVWGKRDVARDTLRRKVQSRAVQISA
jgi:hypothetical protein